MLEPVALTEQDMREQEFLHHQGYLKLPNIFDERTTDLARQALLSFFDLPDDPSSALLETTPLRIYKQYQALQTIPAIKPLATSSNLLGSLEKLLGPNIALTLNRHNHASVHLPDALPDKTHRDHGEHTRGLLTAVIYLEPTTIDNGCTWIIPGSQHWASSNQAVNGGYWLDDMPYSYLAEQAVPLPMGAGDVLVFDAMAFHNAGQNTSSRTRTTVTLGYHSIDQLSGGVDPEKLMLVRGTDVYRGNDD